MTIFDSPAFEGHEAIHAFHDPHSGLKCIIAVHSTARGPSAGGCRMWGYHSDQAAIDDALRLSRAMSYKNAVADLELGGGKAVIIGDSRTQKTPALFEALGRAIEEVGGRYWAAEDVGVSPADLAHARKHTRYVAGLTGAQTVKPDAIFDAQAQVFAPCALGGVLTLETLSRLKGRVIAGEIARARIAQGRD